MIPALILAIAATGTIDPDIVRANYAQRAARAGYSTTQWRCLDALIYRESRWNPHAQNHSSSAHGLFQLLNLPKRSNLDTQWQRGIRYIQHRYGTPCNALQHNLKLGWY